jgi:hypothetical protein
MNGEAQLAASVIQAAIEDLGIGPRCRITGEKRREINESVAFLTDKNGAWASSRKLWCAMSGIDESAVVQKGESLKAAIELRMQQEAERRLKDWVY